MSKKILRKNKGIIKNQFLVHIQIQSKQSFVPSIGKLRQWAKLVLSSQLKQGEMSISVVTAQAIKKMNARYRKKDKPTNVLSFRANFPGQDKLHVPLLGDIMICSAVVNREAKQQGKIPTAHWAHMVVHGILHLLGHDHIKQSEAMKMEKLEIHLLKRLGFTNPYLL